MITVIGGGLAGCEAVHQIAERGIPVTLFEMRPHTPTPVHRTGNLAELICSNSMGNDTSGTAPGLLKEELRKMDSLIMKAVDDSRIPAGQALAVDRDVFSRYIEKKLDHPLIRIIREEQTDIPETGIVIVATGPVTSERFSKFLSRYLGKDFLFFYDAVSPIISAESIDMNRAFVADRYGKGNGDYLNCSMSEEQYRQFYDFLINAERINPHDFEKGYLFEGCMPIEEIADRGYRTLLFGPFKPVGLDENATAVVQLRRENAEGTLYNLVGFQTRLRWGEQKRLIRMIPGLEQAEIVRYGVMHRNIYISSPGVLSPTLYMKRENRIFFAGQITGVEGYMESAMTGLIAGLNAVALHEGRIPDILPPQKTVTGALLRFITDEERTRDRKFQPMNANFGIIPQPDTGGRKVNKQLMKEIRVIRAREAMDGWLYGIGQIRENPVLF